MDFIGLEDIQGSETVKKLVVYIPSAGTSPVMQIPRSALVGHSNITIHNKLLDAHFYIFNHWVLEIMEKLPCPKSIKITLIPKLIELQNDVSNQG